MASPSATWLNFYAPALPDGPARAMIAPFRFPVPNDAAPHNAAGRNAAIEKQAQELAAPLPPLLVAAQRVAATVAQGVHGRRRVGQGESFWQFRPYETGDAATLIDWRQSARAQRLYVREQEWEAAESVWLWRDASPSMAYRSSTSIARKSDHAALLLLALGWLLTGGGERIAVLGDGARPATGRNAVMGLARALALSDPATPAAYQAPGGKASAGLPAFEALPRHSRLVLIGDFLDPLPQIHALIGRFADRGIHGHLVQILDPAEESLPFKGRVRFEGLEGEAPLVAGQAEALRAAYIAKLGAHRDGLCAIASAAGWSFALHHSDQAPQAALLGLYAALGRPPAVGP